MARLEWNNVEAPDFRGAAQGSLAAAKLFGDAMESARAGIQDFQKAQGESADNAVNNALLKYQGDPKALEAAMADGSFMQQFHPSVAKHIGAETRQTLLTRPADLLAHAVKTSEYAQQQKLVADDDDIRANRPIVNAWLGAKDRGNSDEVAKIEAENKDFFGRISPDRLQAMHTSGQGVFGADTGNSQADYNLKSGMRNDAETRSFDLMTHEADEAGAGDTGAAVRYMSRNKDRFIKEHGEFAYYGALSKLQGGLGSGGSGGAGDATDAASGAGGVGAGGNNVYDVLLGDGQGQGGGNKYGFNTDTPISQMTMGQLHDYQRTTMVPKTAALGVGNGQGSSAAGAYQIVSKTLERVAPQVFGANWRTMKFDAAAQDKLGKALFDEAKANGTDLHKVWEGLPAGSSPKNETWDSVRNKITRAESGGVTNPRQATVATATITAQNLSSNAETRLVKKYASAWQDDSSSAAVAKRLTDKGGVLVGQDYEALIQKIDDLSVKYGAAPSVVAVALEDAMHGKDSIIKPTGWHTLIDRLLGDDIKMDFNEKKLANSLRFASNRAEIEHQAQTIDAAAQSQAGVAKSNAAVQQVNDEMNAAVARYRRVGRQMPAEEQDYYNGLLRDAQGGQRVALNEANRVTQETTPADQRSGQGSSSVTVDVPLRAGPPVTLAKATKSDDPIIRKAASIKKLRGEIAVRQAADFKNTYGVTIDDAIAHPQTVAKASKATNKATTMLASAVTRPELIINANAAIRQGAKAIAAFQLKYGQHPRVFLK